MRAREAHRPLLASCLVLILACGERGGARSVGAKAEVARASGGPRPASCEGCHPAITEEWRSSLHRAAFSDETFQTSLGLEEPQDRAFCVGCHAPAAARAGLSAGVDCLACHGAPHEARASSPSSACASCHEFPFERGRLELVQKTATEHAESAYADVPCAGCHMPAREGHRDHRFLAGHAPERVGRAVRVEVARGGQANVLRVSIRVDAGHAFPTGDMFRRARLVIFAEGSRGQIVAYAERTFGRTWGGALAGGQAGPRTQEGDTRIRGAWRGLVALDEPSSPIVRARWSLLYERVIAVRGPHATVASSDSIAEGEIAW